MKVITVNICLTKELVDAVDKVVETGRYRSRSEFIREAIRNLLARERVLIATLKK